MCRTYNVIGVMNNSNKWSGLNIRHNIYDKVVYSVSQNGIRKSDGTIKKNYINRLNRLTISDCLWLYNRGCTVTIA